MPYTLCTPYNGHIRRKKMNAGNVFRAYDIRGVVDKDFNAEWVIHLGKACGFNASRRV